MDVGTSVTIIGVSFGIFVSTASIIKTLYGKRFCEDHIKVMGVFTSEVATLKNCMMKLVIYVTGKASDEGRDLNKELIDQLMKK